MPATGFVAFDRLKRDPEAMAIILNRFKGWKDKNKGAKPLRGPFLQAA